ncbi:MAG: hypothetical protein KAX20_00920 [Candidatus Omnitrophica bacterium]|nr:hypothetical protein [Candidatus Omnitrophota bacterium]
MNKGKQWKWNKKTRKKLEEQGKPPLKINIIKAKKSWGKVTHVAFPGSGGFIPLEKKPRPKRLRGICLNWPGEVKKKDV